jgi:hypothetical protein
VCVCVCVYRHTCIHGTYIHTYDRLKVYLKFVKETNICNTSYNLDNFKYFLVMFCHEKFRKNVKLYTGELIIFFESGKNEKVYNISGD